MEEGHQDVDEEKRGRIYRHLNNYNMEQAESNTVFPHSSLNGAKTAQISNRNVFLNKIVNFVHETFPSMSKVHDALEDC